MKPPAAMKIRPHTAQEPVSLMDIGPTVLSLAGIHTDAKFDGQSLLTQLRGGSASGDRVLLFFGGWHVGVNFPCGIQEWKSDGTHHLYS
jgi:arylsulfatase A-like enzyme